MPSTYAIVPGARVAVNSANPRLTFKAEEQKVSDSIPSLSAWTDPGAPKVIDGVGTGWRLRDRRSGYFARPGNAANLPALVDVGTKGRKGIYFPSSATSASNNGNLIFDDVPLIGVGSAGLSIGFSVTAGAACTGAWFGTYENGAYLSLSIDSAGRVNFRPLQTQNTVALVDPIDRRGTSFWGVVSLDPERATMRMRINRALVAERTDVTVTPAVGRMRLGASGGTTAALGMVDGGINAFLPCLQCLDTPGRDLQLTYLENLLATTLA